MVWNLRAVIWFPFPISSLVFVPSLLALSVSSFICQWSILLTFLQKILNHFLCKDQELGFFAWLLLSSWEMRVGRRYVQPYGTGIWHYAFIFNIFSLLLFLSIPSYYISLVGYWWIRQNGSYQHVLALCAILSGVVLKGRTVSLVSCLCKGCFCGSTSERIYIWGVSKCAFVYDRVVSWGELVWLTECKNPVTN